MHLQGRRWGACRECSPAEGRCSCIYQSCMCGPAPPAFECGGGSVKVSYDSPHPRPHRTFQSYGVAPGDREGLRKAMPEEHQRFLQDMARREAALNC